MKISREEDYALTLVSFLAARPDRDFVSLAEAAKKNKLPAAFLKKIAHKLKIAGLIEVKEGRQGGYRLAKLSELITIGEILLAINPQPLLPSCLLGADTSKCPSYQICTSRSAWRKVSQRIYKNLQKMKISEFVNQ